MMKLISKNNWGLKAVNYFHKNIPWEIWLSSKYISDIQTFKRKSLQKFASGQNKLLADLFF